MKTVGRLIKYLRKQIPTFKCRKGCTDCCGVIFFSEWEWKQIKDKKTATSLTCPYAKIGIGCEIYDQRPIICRMYGNVPTLMCPHGCKPDKLLSAKKEAEIMNKYDYVLNQHL